MKAKLSIFAWGLIFVDENYLKSNTWNLYSISILNMYMFPAIIPIISLYFLEIVSDINTGEIESSIDHHPNCSVLHTWDVSWQSINILQHPYRTQSLSSTQAQYAYYAAQNIESLDHDYNINVHSISIINKNALHIYVNASVHVGVSAKIM